MKSTVLRHPLFSQGRHIARVAGVTLFLFAGPLGLKADDPPEGTGDAPANPLVKDERPPGGDGSMFYRVFVSRNDQNGDGVIEKSEFRGSGDRFDQMDENKSGKLDRNEIDALHRSRMADPLSMRQRIARRETRRPPVDLPFGPDSQAKSGDALEADGEPTALTPMGTRITAKQAYARLDVNQDGEITAQEFQRSPGMADPEKAAQVVTRIDRDGDGTLSFDEFNTVFAQRHGKPSRVAPPPLFQPEFSWDRIWPVASVANTLPDGRFTEAQLERLATFPIVKLVVTRRNNDWNALEAEARARLKQLRPGICLLEYQNSVALGDIGAQALFAEHDWKFVLPSGDVLTDPKRPEEYITPDFRKPLVRDLAVEEMRKKLNEPHIDGWEKLIARPDANELYDLKNDPDDRTDISTQHPGKVEQLSAEIEAWLDQTPIVFPETP